MFSAWNDMNHQSCLRQTEIFPIFLTKIFTPWSKQYSCIDIFDQLRFMPSRKIKFSYWLHILNWRQPHFEARWVEITLSYFSHRLIETNFKTVFSNGKILKLHLSSFSVKTMILFSSCYQNLKQKKELNLGNFPYFF